MSSQILSRLDILLTADSAQVSQEMGRAAQATESSFDRIKTAAKSMAGILAGAFTVDAIVDFARAQFDAAVELDNMARSVGISAQQLGALQLEAKKAGLETDRITDAMSGLNEKLLDAAAGGKDAKAFFDALGVSVVDATGQVKNADVALQDIATAFAGMADGATKSAIASELMGDAGAELIPILNQGGAALRANAQAAIEMGAVLSDQTIGQVRLLKSEMAQTGAVVDAAKNSIMAGLLPTLTNLAQKIREMATQGDAARSVTLLLDGTLKGLATVAIVVGSAFEFVGKTVGKVTAALVTMAPSLEPLKNARTTIGILGGVVGMAQRADIRGAIDILMQDNTTMAGVLTELAGRIKSVWSAAGDAATTGAQQTKQAAAASLAALKTLQAANASPEKSAKAKAGKGSKGFDATDLAWHSGEFASEMQALQKELQKADEDRAKAAQDAYDKLKTTATGYYQTVLEGRTLLDAALVVHDQTYLQQQKAAIAEQGLLEQLIFQSSNEAKLEAARQADANESFLAQARMDRLNSEHAEKLALVQQAFEAEILSAQEAARIRNQLAQESAAMQLQVEQQQTEQRRANWQVASSFYLSSLNTMAQGQGKAAKAAKEVNKAMALWQIAQDTRSAAMAAYKALAGIPVVGPGLGAAAAAAAIAFGAVQAKAVMSDASPSGGGPAASPSVQPIAPVTPVTEQPKSEPISTVQVPADTLFTGRQIVDLINDALGDGKRLTGSVAFSTY